MVKRLDDPKTPIVKIFTGADAERIYNLLIGKEILPIRCRAEHAMLYPIGSDGKPIKDKGVTWNGLVSVTDVSPEDQPGHRRIF